MRRFFEAAAALLAETDYSFGCPVAPVILDAPEALPELEEICREAFEEWLGLFRARFEAAGVPAARAASLALLVEAAIEGLLVIARARRDTAAFAPVATELAALVAAAVPAEERVNG